MLETIGRLLHELVGARIAGTTNLGSAAAPVLRVTLDAPRAGIGATVIAKARPRPGVGWNADPGYLENERRALEHLRRSGVDATPRVLGAEAGVLVMTDLGPGPSVEALLMGSWSPIAEAGTPADSALIAMARAVGTVHGVRAPEPFRATCGVPFLDGPLGAWDELRTAAEDLGFPVPTDVAADVEALALALGDERFQGFTHGDLTPGNALVLGGEGRLLDFEGAGTRHLGIDAASLRLSFPQYRHWAALPPRVLSAMERAYRAELAAGQPAVEAGYEQMLAEGCLAWAVVRASRLRLIASDDQSTAETVRRRTQIVHTLTSTVASVAPTGMFPALTAWFGDLVDEMKARWREARLDPRTFTAFAPLPAVWGVGDGAPKAERP
jgi:Phosphotransferase enzyme family